MKEEVFELLLDAPLRAQRLILLRVDDILPKMAHEVNGRESRAALNGWHFDLQRLVNRDLSRILPLEVR